MTRKNYSGDRRQATWSLERVVVSWKQSARKYRKKAKIREEFYHERHEENVRLIDKLKYLLKQE
jgi:hypothetical protein